MLTVNPDDVLSSHIPSRRKNNCSDVQLTKQCGNYAGGPFSTLFYTNISNEIKEKDDKGE